MNKNITQAINVQQTRQVDPWPALVRQMSSIKKPGGIQSSAPPPPPPPTSSSLFNNQTFWLSFAAVFLGGGAYLAYTLNEDEQAGTNEIITPAQPKKCKFHHLQCKFYNHQIYHGSKKIIE